MMGFFFNNLFAFLCRWTTTTTMGTGSTGYTRMPSRAGISYSDWSSYGQAASRLNRRYICNSSIRIKKKRFTKKII
jgi:hypothetical protein